MSWVAGRLTTILEDVVYWIIRMFDVNTQPMCSGVRKAFMELQKILMEAACDKSIFVWTALFNNDWIAIQELMEFRR